MADLKPVYQAINEEEGMAALLRFTEKWGKQYPSCAKSWNDNWDILSTFLHIRQSFGPAVFSDLLNHPANKRSAAGHLVRFVASTSAVVLPKGAKVRSWLIYVISDEPPIRIVYDHSFPLRYKAQKRIKHMYHYRSNQKFVKVCLRKQVYYRARGGEWAQRDR